MTQTYQAAGKNLLVVLADINPKTSGGIHVPLTVSPDLPQGIAVAVGPEVTTVRQNQNIILRPGAGYPLTYNGKKAVFVHIDDVIGFNPQ